MANHFHIAAKKTASTCLLRQRPLRELLLEGVRELSGFADHENDPAESGVPVRMTREV